MISEIEATRRLPEPQYPGLKAWLQRHGGSDLSEQDAIELYALRVWFLNQIYGH